MLSRCIVRVPSTAGRPVAPAPAAASAATTGTIARPHHATPRIAYRPMIAKTASHSSIGGRTACRRRTSSATTATTESAKMIPAGSPSEVRCHSLIRCVTNGSTDRLAA